VDEKTVAVPISPWAHIKDGLDAIGRIPENAWGYGVLILAGALALVAHGTGDKDLYGIVSGMGMTGAAIMHAKKD
jgi:hypothetical protein